MTHFTLKFMKSHVRKGGFYEYYKVGNPCFENVNNIENHRIIFTIIKREFITSS